MANRFGRLGYGGNVKGKKDHPTTEIVYNALHDHISKLCAGGPTNQDPYNPGSDGDYFEHPLGIPGVKVDKY